MVQWRPIQAASYAFMPNFQALSSASENVSSRLPARGRLPGGLSPYWPAAYCLAHIVTPSPSPGDQQGCEIGDRFISRPGSFIRMNGGQASRAACPLFTPLFCLGWEDFSSRGGRRHRANVITRCSLKSNGSPSGGGPARRLKKESRN